MFVFYYPRTPLSGLSKSQISDPGPGRAEQREPSETENMKQTANCYAIIFFIISLRDTENFIVSKFWSP